MTINALQNTLFELAKELVADSKKSARFSDREIAEKFRVYAAELSCLAAAPINAENTGVSSSA